MSEAKLWVSENVKVGWIGEALRLPLTDALVPIVERALADGRSDADRCLSDALGEVRRYLHSLVALKAVEGPTIREHINIVEAGLRKAGRL